ncbi:hypothetical protein BGY98DRAFT_935358 [Russula aff. rugulosa BPL654]|nr:hypothetical protein BGY98DRAFT_935358 [Russula aff. rugulosa BPL654]
MSVWLAFVFCVFYIFFLFSNGAHRIAQSLRQLKHSLAVPSTPSDGTITRRLKGFHVVCLSGTLACTEFEKASDNVAADRTGCVALYTPLPRGPVVEGVTSKSTYHWAPNFDPSVAKGG